MVAPRILPYGQDAVYIDLGIDAAPDRAARTQTLARALSNRWKFADVVVGGGVLVVTSGVDVAEVTRALSENHLLDTTNVSPGKTFTIQAVYDGPDLEDVASTLRTSPDEVIEIHQANEYVVELLGFLPGFGYLGPVDPRLRLPRRKAPRPKVPAGSIAIAGGFTGIYPFASPGGWHLLGRAVGVTLFDPNRDPYLLFDPGDRVRFQAIAASETPPVAPDKPILKNVPTSGPAFAVEFAPACATVQSAGREGRLSRGLPPSGPLDPDTFAAANLAVGNDPGEAAIEIPLGRLVLRAIGELVLSLDGDKPIRLTDGERFEVPENPNAVRYLAVRGGIDVPLVLGSRATLLVARVGGFSGRPLRRGDVVQIGDRFLSEPLASPALPSAENVEMVEIAIDPGPHVDRFAPGALDNLLGSTYCISTLGDRVGLRLDGPKIPRDGADSALPVPMIRGAMQISTDGTPIVFGPDHPTTGGYPVLAVVRRSSWGKLARRRAGYAVRFVRGG